MSEVPLYACVTQGKGLASKQTSESLHPPQLAGASPAGFRFAAPMTPPPGSIWTRGVNTKPRGVMGVPTKLISMDPTWFSSLIIRFRAKRENLLKFELI